MKHHSERVPEKNWRNFNGRPLFRVVLDLLLEEPLVDKVIINTDSQKIKTLVANLEAVTVVDRPSELCGDMVPMNDIINHDISLAEGDLFLQTHSTNPLLTPATLHNALQSFLEEREKYDSLFTVTKHQTRLYDKSANAVNHDPSVLMRTQDLDPLFEENSCLYVFSRDSFESSGHRRIGNKPKMFEIPKLEAVDIDNPEDFLLAEALYKLRNVSEG